MKIPFDKGKILRRFHFRWKPFEMEKELTNGTSF